MAPKSKSKPSKSISSSKAKLKLSKAKGDHALVAFPGAVPNGEVKFTIEGRSDSVVVKGKSKSCTFESRRVKRKVSHLIEAGEGSDNEEGTGGGSLSGGSSNPMTTTMVAVYDKSSGSVTLYHEEDMNMLAPLSQSINKYKPVVKDNALEEHSYAARRDALYESFGSSKKLKVLKSQKANEVKISNVIGGGDMNTGLEAMEQSKSNKDAMENARMGKEEADVVAESVEISRKALLPKYDEKAKSPRMVYKARDIAGDEVWGFISRMVDGCCHDDGWMLKLNERLNFENAVKNEFAMMQTGALEKDDRTKVKSLILLNHLMAFSKETGGFKFKGKSPEDLSKRTRLPEVVCIRLLSQFAQRNEENGGYLFTKQLKDKLVVHMLILFMVACGGKEVKCATFGTLLRNLKMETKVAGDFLRMAGVNVKKASDGGVAAELKVPLTFHSGVKRGRGKG